MKHDLNILFVMYAGVGRWAKVSWERNPAECAPSGYLLGVPFRGDPSPPPPSIRTVD